MFYKVIKDNKEIIDVLDNLIFVRKQITHNRLVLCDKDIAQGIISSNGENVWFVEGMIKNNPDELPTVTLVEIDEDEYNILREALDSNKPVEVPEPPKEENEEWEDDNNDEAITVEFVREAKISEMSRKCNETIVNGFDIELSDKKTHHFDFTVDDQLNMISLKEMIASSIESIPYHAQNEPCKFYSVDDIQLILEAGTNLKTYQITYFNSLKQYIKSLRSINTISKVYYGMEVPEKYKTEVLLALLNETE